MLYIDEFGRLWWTTEDSLEDFTEVWVSKSVDNRVEKAVRPSYHIKVYMWRPLSRDKKVDETWQPAEDKDANNQKEIFGDVNLPSYLLPHSCSHC